MTKKFKYIFVGFVFGCVLTLTTPVLADTIIQTIDVTLNTVKVEINGEKLDTDNILYNGTTYLPMRAIAEAVDKDVEWNQRTMTANIVNKEKEINTNNGDIMETTINNINYKEFIKVFNVGEIIVDYDNKDKEYYLNKCVYNGDLNDEEFFNWIYQQKGYLNDYLTNTLNDIFPNPEKTSKISLEKIREDGKTFFIGNAIYDIDTHQITVNINQDIK